MSRRMIFVLLLMLPLVLTGPVLSVKGQNLQQTDTPPETIKVGIYLIRAGALDISTGAIDVDFYLEFTCPSTCKDKITDFEIMNGVTKSKPLVEDEDSETAPIYRVSATVFQDVSLIKYPFDSHDIKIVIEGNFDNTELVYAVNPKTTAIDPKVFILGWDLDKQSVKAEIIPQYYPAWDSTYTRYVFKAHISKPALAGWLKGLLPAIFIALGSIFALFITTKNIGNRVAIITSALVASVLYHLNFTSRVPPIGYLTFGDNFMIINYIVILISLAITIWIIRSDAPERQEAVKRVNRIEIYAIPGLWIILHILNALWIL